MGIFNRLFKRDTRSTEQNALTVEAAQQIVQQYRLFLEDSAPLPGRVSDVSHLPHRKEIIKDAILVCIRAFRDPSLTEHLRHGYLMLSAWQSGVGEKDLGPDFSQLDLEADPMELAELIQQKSAAANKWTPLIKTEQAVLESELQAIGA